MNDHQPGKAPQDDLASDAQDARTRSLDARLQSARARETRRTAPPRAPGADDGGYGAGNRVLADLIGGIVGGLFLGWVIDRFAGTQPWGLLVMMFVGIGIAFRNIVRNAGRGGG